MARKVLVTGATGFLGSRLARALVEAGESVKVLARPGSSLKALRGLDVEVCIGDVMIEHTVFRALAGCDRMYHCAAVYALWAPRAETIMAGAIVGTECALRAARARDLERVVYTSSAYTIGGTHQPDVRNEDSAWIEPRGPVYAIAKRRAEEWALEFARETQLPLVVVNPTSIFGPGDWKPTPTGAMILEVLRAPVLPGLGTLVPLPPGGFNVVDVDDVARGHMLAMRAGRLGERYILGAEDLPVAGLFETVAELAGKPKPRLKAGRTVALATGAMMSTVAAITGNVPALSYDTVKGSFGYYYYVSSAKAQRELGYAARPARQTLARAIRNFVDNGFLSHAAVRRLRLDPTTMAAA